MYFDKVFYDEEYKPQTIQFICDKCGEYIEFQYDDKYISNIKAEYCIVTNGSKIVCKCGNRCQSGLVEPKKISKEIHIHQQSRSCTQSTLNKPKCPTCQSTNLKKISATSKVMNTAMFGIFGTKRHKTFHCNNCGYEW